MKPFLPVIITVLLILFAAPASFPEEEEDEPGRLSRPRSGHAALLQSDGTILITGGQNAGGALASAERFDPLSLTFSPLGGRMGTARADHTASALSDQTALIVAGQTGGAVIAGAERHDPLTGLFSNLLDTVRIPRSGHTATVLLDGRVVIIGGRSTTALETTEMFDAQSVILFKPSFDPKAGSFTVLSHALSAPRWDHTATLLPDGRVLIAGGRNDPGYLSSAEFFDPAAESFSQLLTQNSQLIIPRAGHTATLLPDGRVLILGGRNESGALGEEHEAEGNDDLSAAEVFEPATGIFAVLEKGLKTPRADHTATLLGFGKIVVMGGENSEGVLDTAEIYKLKEALAGEDPEEDEDKDKTGNKDANKEEEEDEGFHDEVNPNGMAVSPSDGTTGVDLTEIIGVRFSEPVDVTTLNPGSISLTGGGAVDSMIGPSEQGLMVFLVPKTPLYYPARPTPSRSTRPSAIPPAILYHPS